MQKKTSWILLGALILLGGIYFQFIQPFGSSSLAGKEIDFAIEDTASVSKIVLTRVAEGENIQRLVLEKKSNGDWQLNEKYPAFQPRVRTLLETIHLIHVSEVLADVGAEAGKELMANKHTLVEVYEGRRLIKSYKVGTEGKGGRGTLMMLTGAEKPYMVEIPGLQGYVNSRYSMELGVWRENMLFNGHLANLKSIEIAYKEKTEQSFKLWREYKDQNWQVNEVDVSLDTLGLQTYLSYFTGKVYAETFANSRYPGKLQALKGIVPDIELELTYLSGENRKIKLYERPENPNNYFGWVDGSDELLTVQRFVIDKYLIDREYLSGKTILNEK